MKAVFALAVLVVAVAAVESTVVFDRNGYNGLSGLGLGLSSALSPLLDGFRKRCPVCDSSVYPYCSDKLFHDSCCCHQPNSPYDRLPYECQYADCTFLHANTCYEHRLISSCCCTNYIVRK